MTQQQQDEVTRIARGVAQQADQLGTIQVSFVRPQGGFNITQDLASMIYRELSKLPNVRPEEQRRLSQRYADSMGSQSGNLSEARRIFDKLVNDFDAKDDGKVPYAINLAFLVHIDALEGKKITGIEVQERVQEASKSRNAFRKPSVSSGPTTRRPSSAGSPSSKVSQSWQATTSSAPRPTSTRASTPCSRQCPGSARSQRPISTPAPGAVPASARSSRRHRNIAEERPHGCSSALAFCYNGSTMHIDPKKQAKHILNELLTQGVPWRAFRFGYLLLGLVITAWLSAGYTSSVTFIIIALGLMTQGVTYLVLRRFARLVLVGRVRTHLHALEAV
jgi:hypothetical protein